MADWSIEKLRRIREARQTKPSFRPLGTLVDNVLERLVYPRQGKLSRLQAAWRELLPNELQAHSRLERLYRGQLQVLVDNAASLYEIKLLVDQGLAEQLQRLCPAVKLSRIKIVRGQWEQTSGKDL
ncbi:MAG: hypothetical protein AMJ79_09895 [Phycisphaerae bacterium SM23_30]|nr:MAG: hypothetical protein AMJ79_09895 [Phycisphaerae bacterium SM23_30]